MLDKYLERINLRAPLPTEPLQKLRTLHTSHLSQIPFENLSIHLGEGVSVRPEDLVRKLVDERRGGYCFENNLLSYEVLRGLGFQVALRGARVFSGSQVNPISHLVLEVNLDGQRWLYDVGFGGNGIRFPQIMNGEAQEQQFYQARLRDTQSEWILEKLPRGEANWVPVYAIQKIDFHYIDCVVANHYTSTHPDSIFTKTLTVQKFFSDSRIIYRKSDQLRRTLLTEAGESTEEVSADEALKDIKDRFGFKSEFHSEIETLIS